MAATKLAFTTQPAGYTSEGVLTTQPVVTAQNSDGSTDTAFVGIVTLTPSVESSRFYTTTPLLTSSHTVQAGTTASTVLVSPALSFPTTLPPSYANQGYVCYIDSAGGAVQRYTRVEIAGNTGTGQLDLATPFYAIPTTGATLKVHSGVMPRAVAKTCVAGVATFSGLSLAGFEATALVASSSGLTSATSSSLTPTGSRDGPAELPRVTVTTAAPTVTGTTVTVGPSGATYTDLQAAIDARVAANSNLNDTIVLQSGATFTAVYTLGKKSSGTGWITIKGHTDPCAEGTRCQPADFSSHSIAKVIVPSGGAIGFSCDAGAHHWRLQGFEITHNADSNGLVNFTDRVGEAADINNGLQANMTHHLIVDRMYIHDDGTHNCKYAVKLNCGEAGVVDSYLTTIDRNNDCQAIVDFGGQGPYRIHNNHQQAPSENVIFGGADPYVTGSVTSDVTMTSNYFYKPTSWLSDPAITAKVKNLVEFKSCRRVLFEGNVMENNWAGGQTGSGLLITPVNQQATAVNAGVRDLTIRKNVLRNSSSGFNITQENSELGVPSVGCWRVAIHDNAVWNINDPVDLPADRRLTSMFDGCYDVWMQHNTMLGSVSETTRAIVFNDPLRPAKRSKYDNNLTTAQGGAVVASGDTPGGPSINHCLLTAGGTFANNALVDFNSGSGGTGYPASTLFPATNANVGFATVGITSTWDSASIDSVLAALTITTAGTPDLRTAASDGVPVGANMTAVRSAVLGVVEGTPGTGSTADHLAITTQPSATTASGVAHAAQPTGTVQDASNATVTSDTSTVTASWVNATGSGTAGGTLTKAAVAGAWAFTNLSVTSAAGCTGHWHFADGSLTGVDSSTITITAVQTADHFAVSVQPVGGGSGVALPTQPVVRVADVGGSTVTSDTRTVLLTLNTLSGSGELTGVVGIGAMAGVATFVGVVVTGSGTFTLTFTDATAHLAPVTSASFTVTDPNAPDYGITAGAPAVYRMARGKAVFGGFRRTLRALWRWLTLSHSLA